MRHPEHSLQVALVKLVRVYVAQPHLFISVDAAKSASSMQRIREKARGVLSGTPDTLLVVPTLPLIAVELKAPGNRPTDRQMQVGAAITAAGHHWGWADSCAEYFRLLSAWGVPVIGTWWLAAQDADARLASAAIRAEESKTGRPSRARSAYPTRPSKAALARGARMAQVRP